VGYVFGFSLIDCRLRDSSKTRGCFLVTKLIDRGVDVDFDICYRPCMVPFSEFPKQDLRVPRLVNLQQ
jgi:hypothetical protein